jgi:hypothetical protein
MISLLLALAAAATPNPTPPPELSVAERRIVDSFIASQTGPVDPECASCNPLEYPEYRQYLLADVTGDGIPDVLVRYTLEEGNNWTLFLVVFDRVGMRCIVNQKVGGKGYRSVDIQSARENSIDLRAELYAMSDALCCPSIPATVHLVLSNGAVDEASVDLDDPRDRPRVRWAQW